MPTTIRKKKSSVSSSPYLDVMTFRHSHLLRDGIGGSSQLVLDPVLIPNLEHTGVEPSLDLEDHLIFHSSRTCNKCGQVPILSDDAPSSPQQRNDGSPIRHHEVAAMPASSSSPSRSPVRKGGHNAIKMDKGNNVISEEEEDKLLGRAKWDPTTTVEHALFSNLPASSRSKGWNAGRRWTVAGAVGQAENHDNGGAGAQPRKIAGSPPKHHGEQDGRYDLNGIKTIRKKPTADAQARSVVEAIRSASQKMGILVFEDT